MINAREQIANALGTACSNVKLVRPEGDVVPPLICFAETRNIPVNMAYTRLRWRVSVYASTFAELVSLTATVDDIMSSTLGYTRVSKTPDDDARLSRDLYVCKLDYSGIVNTRTLGVIKYSI